MSNFAPVKIKTSIFLMLFAFMFMIAGASPILSFDKDDSATFSWMQNLENEMDENYHEETIFTGIL